MLKEGSRHLPDTPVLVLGWSCSRFPHSPWHHRERGGRRRERSISLLQSGAHPKLRASREGVRSEFEAGIEATGSPYLPPMGSHNSNKQKARFGVCIVWAHSSRECRFLACHFNFTLSFLLSFLPLSQTHLLPLLQEPPIFFFCPFSLPPQGLRLSIHFLGGLQVKKPLESSPLLLVLPHLP